MGIAAQIVIQVYLQAERLGINGQCTQRVRGGSNIMEHNHLHAANVQATFVTIAMTLRGTTHTLSTVNRVRGITVWTAVT